MLKRPMALFVMVCAALTARLAPAAILYGVNSNFSPNILVTLDTSSGTLSPVVPLPIHVPFGFPVTTGLTFTPDGTLYAAEGQGNQLLTIDPATGQTTVIASLGPPAGAQVLITGLASDSRGTLYGANLIQTPSRRFDLVTLDRTTAAVTTIGVVSSLANPVGTIGGISGLAFSPAGVLFAAGMTVTNQAVLFALDTATGHSVVVTNLDRRVTGIDFAPDGTLFGVDAVTDKLVTIDIATGKSRVIGPLGANYGGAGIAFRRIAVVPEPSAWLLWPLGLLGLLWPMRAKRPAPQRS